MSQHRGEVDPVSRIIARNVCALLDEYGWSHEKLAAMIPMSRPTLTKYLLIANPNPKNPPEFKEWSVGLSLTVAGIFDTTVEELSRDRATEARRAPGIKAWNLSVDSWQEVDQEYTNLNQYRKKITAFYTYLPFCAMAPGVLHKCLLSRFGARMRTMRGEMLFGGFKEYGQSRYVQYIDAEKHQIADIDAYMSGEGFHRFRRGEPPFDICTPEEMSNCLDHLRKCIEKRNFHLHVLSAGKGDLHDRGVEDADTIVYVHGRGVMRIEKNQRIFLYDQAQHVKNERDLIDHLSCIVELEPQLVLEELARFQDELDNETHPLCHRNRHRREQ